MTISSNTDENLVEPSDPRVSVVVLAYGEESLLNECVRAILASTRVNIELIVVDNGSPAITSLVADPRLRVVSPGFNTGFAGGCNFGVRETTSPLLAFVNSDLIVSPNAIHLLVNRLNDEGVGLVTGAVLLPGTPLVVNSIGNPIHYLMFSWAGDYGEDFERHRHDEDVAGISGALFACTTSHWQFLDGFDEEYFAYAEDADISLRTWQAGLKVVFEHRATGEHHYEFSRRTEKWFWLERNRLIGFLTFFTVPMTIMLLPIFIVVEIGVMYSAIRSGWWRQKIQAWSWIFAHRTYLRQRRQRIKGARVSGSQWLNVLSSTIDIPDEFDLHVPQVVNSVLKFYWSFIRRLERPRR